MSNVNSVDLIGYLSFGRFNVNDYVLELGRGTEKDGRTGMVLQVFNTAGELLTHEMCYDGEPGMTEAEVKAVKDLFERMRDALPQWTDAEARREAAERLRRIAEYGEDGKGEGTGNRQGLYKEMLDLYGKFKPKLDILDENLKKVEEQKAAAEKAAQDATAAAEAATTAVFGDLTDMLMYKDGDSIEFVDSTEAKTSGMHVSTETASSALNAIGYVTDSRQSLHLKIPMGKHLTNINHVEWTEFKAHIANGGGYGLTAQHTDDAAKNDYLNLISYTVIDKVQNCIHVVMKRPRGFTLENNACVNCRCISVKFTLMATAPETES